MSDNSSKYLFLGVLGVVLVFLLFSNGIGGITGEAVNSAKARKEINAHSCNADGNCEVNRLISSGKGAGDVIASGVISGKRLLLDGGKVGLEYSPDGPDGVKLSGDSAIVLDSSANDNDKPIYGEESKFKIATHTELDMYAKVGGISYLRTYAPPSVYQFRGSGNAYVCVDSDGKLFRSDKPCK